MLRTKRGLVIDLIAATKRVFSLSLALVLRRASVLFMTRQVAPSSLYGRQVKDVNIMATMRAIVFKQNIPCLV